MARPLKPAALRPHDAVRVVSLASPVQPELLQKGCQEISRLGFAAKAESASVLARESYFAGSARCRRAELEQAFAESETRGIFCSRGGYGSNYLIEELKVPQGNAKIFLGSSDITSLQIYLWQKHGWVTFYGPMVAANMQRGAGQPNGYDEASLVRALTETRQGWELDLQAETLAPGETEGVLLGGCLTLVEASLGTPWELDTIPDGDKGGAILVLEDRGMKPYQVDRALMHLKQAGKFDGIAGLLLGDFPDCEPPEGGETVRDVAQRILAPLASPVVWGAPIGHTARAALTLPLGVRGRLCAVAQGKGGAKLQILEPACAP